MAKAGTQPVVSTSGIIYWLSPGPCHACMRYCTLHSSSLGKFSLSFIHTSLDWLLRLPYLCCDAWEAVSHALSSCNGHANIVRDQRADRARIVVWRLGECTATIIITSCVSFTQDFEQKIHEMAEVPLSYNHSDAERSGQDKTYIWRVNILEHCAIYMCSTLCMFPNYPHDFARRY